MRLENCLEDMSVISNALATVTSNASRFSNEKPKAKSGRAFIEPLGYRRFRGTVKHSAKFAGFKVQAYVSTAGIPVQENRDAAQLAEIESKLAELTAKHVRLANAISGWKAEKIRICFGESRYEELKNVALTIRGLEAFVNKLMRDSEQPHPYLKRLSDSVTEYRLAIADLLLILNQCFNDVDVIASQTGLINEDVFANFSFH